MGLPGEPLPTRPPLPHLAACELPLEPCQQISHTLDGLWWTASAMLITCDVLACLVLMVGPDYGAGSYIAVGSRHAHDMSFVARAFH